MIIERLTVSRKSKAEGHGSIACDRGAHFVDDIAGEIQGEPGS